MVRRFEETEYRVSRKVRLKGITGVTKKKSDSMLSGSVRNVTNIYTERK